MGAVGIPIACTVSADSARAQLAEWSDLLARASVGGRRASPTEIVFRLADDLGHLPEVVALARREKACCSFFRFTMEIETESVELTVGVPTEAAAVLDHFQALITT